MWTRARGAQLFTMILCACAVDAGSGVPVGGAADAPVGGASSQVTWSDNGTRRTAIAAQANFMRVPTLDKVAIQATISATPPAVLLITATGQTPLTVGDYACADASGGRHYAQMAYALSSQDSASSLQDCLVTIRQLPATTGAPITGTFSGTAISPTDVHLLTDGAFSVPLQLTAAGP